MEDFSMNRQFYDVAFKMSVSNEYQAGNETYATLAHKYNVPRSTIASWIRKANKFGILSKKETKMTPGFLNITQEIKGGESISSAEEITLIINGFEIKADLRTVTKLLSGSNHV
ncbi:MAG: helix-turn-helix domain-containing protein [Methanomicrobia archaeon]|jgi:transposase-like protein|nr:helix-turn-helix domain-containing protein [Methanomicrobia archaeon]